MKLFTIGFTKKSAEEFFGLLAESNAKRLIDARLNRDSQLAGFAQGRDLPYLLKHICGMEYVHRPDLAPDEGMLKEWRLSEAEISKEYHQRKNNIGKWHRQRKKKLDRERRKQREVEVAVWREREVAMAWQKYEESFLALMKQRRIDEIIPAELIADSCLLCSEHQPNRCHRRLVVEYLNERWSGIEIVHLT